MKRKKLFSPVLSAVMVLGISLAAMAGDIDSTRDPSQGSGLYTLQELYDYLMLGTIPTPLDQRTSFTEPSSGPGSTMKTTNQILDGVKSVFDQCSPTPAQVQSGVQFFSTDPGNWGLKTGALAGPTGNAALADVLAGKTFSNAGGTGLTGTMPNRGAVNITPGTAAQSIVEGYHNGSGNVLGDGDLVSGNIKKDVDIFGVVGSVLQSTGDAAAGEVLFGKTFSNSTTTGVAGTMADNGAVTMMPGATDQAIAEGYHNGSGNVLGDGDLVSGNVKKDVDIFGVVGTVLQSTGNAAAGEVLSGRTFSNSSEAGVAGTMANRGAVTITPGATDQAIVAGYHNGSGNVLGDGDLVSGNVKKDVDIFGVVGTVLQSTGNAAAGEVLSGKTFSNSSAAGVAGTMANRGAVTMTPGATDQAIAAGYHNGSGKVLGDADLVSGNVKKDVDIFGVVGTVLQSTGNAVAGEVLSGKTFSNSSEAGVAGTMANWGAVTITPGATDQTIAAGYHNGSGKVLGDADLVASNIKQGVNISGVAGSFTRFPAPIYPRTSRFTDNANGMVTDNMTGLIWLKNADCFGSVDWSTAVSDANGLATGACGLTDGSSAGAWRLPNIEELRSLIDYSRYNPALPSGHPFTGVQSYYYWSSPTCAGYSSYAWVVHFYDGVVNAGYKTFTFHVWPVR